MGTHCTRGLTCVCVCVFIYLFIYTHVHTGHTLLDIHLSKSGERSADKGAKVQLLPPPPILKVPSAAGRCVQEGVGHAQVALGSKGRDDLALETQGHQLTSKWGNSS